MTEPTAPSIIALIIQNWLDYQEAERAREGCPTEDDTCLMCPPVWPSRGALKQWVAGLNGADTQIKSLLAENRILQRRIECQRHELARLEMIRINYRLRMGELREVEQS